MIPPLPIDIALAVILLWPALKLAGAALARPKWLRLKALRASLLEKEGLSEKDKAQIRHSYSEAYGSPVEIVMPAVVLLGVPALAVHEIATRRFPADLEQHTRDWIKASNLMLHGTPEDAKIYDDPRFWELDGMAFEISLYRFPVASLVTGLAFLVTLPFLLALYGIRRSLGGLAKRIYRSSAISVQVFAANMGA